MTAARAGRRLWSPKGNPPTPVWEVRPGESGTAVSAQPKKRFCEAVGREANGTSAGQAKLAVCDKVARSLLRSAVARAGQAKLAVCDKVARSLLRSSVARGVVRDGRERRDVAPNHQHGVKREKRQLDTFIEPNDHRGRI